MTIILILGILIPASSTERTCHIFYSTTFLPSFMSNERWHFFGAEAFDLVLRKGKPGEARSAFLHFLGGGVFPPPICQSHNFGECCSRPTTLEPKLEAPSPCSRWSWKLVLEEIYTSENQQSSKSDPNSSDLLIQQVTGHNISKVYRVELMNDVKFHHFQWSLKELPPHPRWPKLWCSISVSTQTMQRSISMWRCSTRFDGLT